MCEKEQQMQPKKALSKYITTRPIFDKEKGEGG